MSEGPRTGAASSALSMLRFALRDDAGRLTHTALALRKGLAIFGPQLPLLVLAPRVGQLLAELRFDRREGVATAQGELVRMSPAELPERIQHLAGFAEPYVSMHPRMAWYLLSSLAIDYSRFRFVDLGCGKGRMLLFAAHFDFAQVIGVELSESLCEAARANIERYCVRHLEVQRPEIWWTSAHMVEVEGDAVFFLFNPFRGPVLRRTLEALVRHAEAGHRSYVIYAGPPETFDDYWSVLGSSFEVADMLLTPLFGHSYFVFASKGAQGS